MGLDVAVQDERHRSHSALESVVSAGVGQRITKLLFLVGMGVKIIIFDVTKFGFDLKQNYFDIKQIAVKPKT